MKHLLCAILLTSLFLTGPASSQNTVLNQVTRWWNASATNHMLSVNSGETNGVLEGQSFYIWRASQPGTRELFRLFSLVQNDHMTSVLTDEGGYALDGPLGHVFVIARTRYGADEPLVQDRCGLRSPRRVLY